MVGWLDKLLLIESMNGTHLKTSFSCQNHFTAPVTLWENAFIDWSSYQAIIRQLVLLEHVGIVLQIVIDYAEMYKIHLFFIHLLKLSFITGVFKLSQKKIRNILLLQVTWLWNLESSSADLKQVESCVSATVDEDTGGCPLQTYRRATFSNCQQKIMWKYGISMTLWLSPSSMGNLPDLWWENSTFPNMQLPRGKLMLRCQFCIHAHLKMPEKMEGSLTLGDFGCWEGERGGKTRLATHQRAALFWSYTAIIFHCLHWSPFLVVHSFNAIAMRLHCYSSPVCSTIAPQEAYKVKNVGINAESDTWDRVEETIL